MTIKERLENITDFLFENCFWLFIAIAALFLIWLNPLLFLSYIKVIRWPFVILLILWYFKKEISILTTEKLQSFFIKAFGVELQGNLADQSKEKKPTTESENLPDKMIQDKINELSETKEKLSTEVETVRRSLAVKEIELDFERTYNRIFGSQFSFLENLVVNGGSLKLELVVNWYVGIQSRFLALKDWDINTYTAFLKNNGLITFENNIFKITEKGKAFLKYIRLDVMYGGYKPL